MIKFYLTCLGLFSMTLIHAQCLELTEDNLYFEGSTRTSLFFEAYSDNAEVGNSTGGDDSFFVEYGPAGFTPGEGELLEFFPPVDTEFDFEITGLTLDTEYDIYISEECDAGSTDQVGPFTYATDPECANLIEQDGGEAFGVDELAFCGIQSKNAGATYTMYLFEDPFNSNVLVDSVTNATPSDLRICEEFTGLESGTDYLLKVVETCTNSEVTDTLELSGFTPTFCESPSFYADLFNSDGGNIELEVYGFQLNQTYSIEYGVSGFTRGQGELIEGTLTQTENDFEVTGLLPNTTYQFYLTMSCIGGTIEMGPYTQSTPSECQAPDLEVEYQQAEAIGLGVSFAQASGQYTIEYGALDFTPGEGTMITGAIEGGDYQIIEVTGLSSETTYDFYISAACPGGSTMVSGPETGTTKELFSVPANDACENAIAITDGVTTGTNLGATGGDRPEVCTSDVNLLSQGVWYTYTPNMSGEVTFDLCSTESGFDTQLEIFSGNCSALICEAEEDDDDFCNLGAHPIISKMMDNGHTYYLYVSGYGFDAGNFSMDVRGQIVSIQEVPESLRYIGNDGSKILQLNGFSGMVTQDIQIMSTTGVESTFEFVGETIQLYESGMFIVRIAGNQPFVQKVWVE